MKKKYKLVMKDGTTHNGYEIEHKPGFVQILSWDGETRFPTTDIEKIYSSKTETFFDRYAPTVIVMIAMLSIAFIEYIF